MKKQVVSYLAPILFFVFPFFVKAQTVPLAKNDASQILKAIVEDWDFRQSETWSEGEKNTLYLLAENIAADQVPKIKEIKFELITSKQIKEKENEQIEYYSFKVIEVEKSFVRVFFSRTYHSAKESNRRREANDAIVEYKCRKTAGKWKVKGQVVSVSAT